MLELLIVLLITVGLGTALAHANVQIAIAFLGALLLAWMGGSMIWSILRGKLHLPSRNETLEPMSSRQLIGLGVLATVSNPFWYAWWLTVAAGYLAQARALGLSAVLVFYTGHICADYAWDTMLSVVVGGGRRWMTDGIYRALLLVCGVFFLYLGWGFLTHGISALSG